MALREFESKFADVEAYDVAEVHAYRGEGDTAVMWLERASRERYSSMIFLKVDPLLRNLLREMNLPD